MTGKANAGMINRW